MLQRERQPAHFQLLNKLQSVKLENSRNQVMQYDTLANTYAKQLLDRFKSHPGGVLADESGLGKILTVLALILSNRRPVEAVAPVELEPKERPKADGQVETKAKAGDQFNNKQIKKKRRKVPPPSSEKCAVCEISSSYCGPINKYGELTILM
jgi:hypothetical protein